jgi:hypothetical protein
MAVILAKRSDSVQWLFVGGELPIGDQLVGVELGDIKGRLRTAWDGSVDRGPNNLLVCI